MRAGLALGAAGVIAGAVVCFLELRLPAGPSSTNSFSSAMLLPVMMGLGVMSVSAFDLASRGEVLTRRHVMIFVLGALACAAPFVVLIAVLALAAVLAGLLMLVAKFV